MMKRPEEWEERDPLLVEEEVAIIVAKTAIEQREAEKCENSNSDNESVQYAEIQVHSTIVLYHMRCEACVLPYYVFP